MALLERTDHATYCPYKGECAYYSIPLGGERVRECGVDLRGAVSPPSRRSRTISPSIPTASTRSRSGPQPDGGGAEPDRPAWSHAA